MISSPQRLRAGLLQQRDAAQRLLDLLGEEGKAIGGNNLQALEALLAAKQQCLADLDAVTQELGLLQPPLPSGTDAMAAVMRGYDPHGTLGLESLWRQLAALLVSCRAQNNVNGKIIALGHRRVQQALSLLRNGHVGTESCYSPSGTRPVGIGSRMLGKV